MEEPGLWIRNSQRTREFESEVVANTMENFLPSRRRFLKAAAISTGAVLLPHGDSFGQTPASPAPATSDARSPDYTVRIGIARSRSRRRGSSRLTTYNGQFPGPLIRFKEGQEARLISSTTPIRPNSCTGTGRWYRSTWTAPRKKVRRSFPRTASVASHSRRGRQVFASITRTIEPGPNSRAGSTVARSAPSTSSQARTRQTTTARCSSS